jgi:hypothetical protein
MRHIAKRFTALAGFLGITSTVGAYTSGHDGTLSATLALGSIALLITLNQKGN